MKNYELSGGGYPETADVAIYEPYDTTEPIESQLGHQFTSRIISADLYESGSKNNSKKDLVGKIVVIKMGYLGDEATTRDLQVEDNCTFGAMIVEGDIIPFRLVIEKNQDRVIQEVRRPDPTEEDGMAVDSQLVERGSGYE